MLSAPLPRRSNPWEASDHLSADFGRMSFDARMPQPLAAPPPAVNPYASSLFAASLPAGRVDLRGLQRGAVAESPFTAAPLLAGAIALNGAQQQGGAGAERAYAD